MEVLTIQSTDLNARELSYADPSRCNHDHAIDVYHRLFNDYNQRKGTNYKSFFWGFSKLLTDNLDAAIEQAYGMIGRMPNTKVLLLNVPDELCLETDFYNFSDEIYAEAFPDELDSRWESIYEERNSERQVIFPYIDKSMVIMEIKKGVNYDI